MICYGISCRKEMPCSVCGRPILAGLNKKTCSRSYANHQRTGIKYHLNRPKDKVVSQKAIKMRLFKERGWPANDAGFKHIKFCKYITKIDTEGIDPIKKKVG